MEPNDSRSSDTRLVMDLRDLILGGQRAAMIHAIARCGIPDLLGEEPLETEELARRSGTVPEVLARVLRALVPNGLVTETSGGKWALTSLGTWLRPSHPGSLHALALYTSEPWMREAWACLETGLRTGDVPFEVANGASYFAYLDRHPEARRVFDGVMASNQAQRIDGLAAAYDWGNFAHIVDVGGGHGGLLFRLLKAHPGLRGTLFDLPDVAAIASRYAVWEGLSDRVNVVAGDFFTDVPPSGDALILSRVLHDWPDKECVHILRACRAAMTESARMLILERVIESGCGQRSIKEADVHMHVVLGGKERTQGDFEQILTGGGFALECLIATGTTDSLVVGRPT